MVWIVVLGVPIGILSAARQGTWIDQATSGGAMFFASIPTFWLGLYLILIFAVGLGWFPSSGFPSIFDEGGLTNIKHLILPSLALAAPNAALIIRLVRASMLDILPEDHVRTARAKGAASVSCADAPRVPQCADHGGRRLRLHLCRPDLGSRGDRNRLLAARRRAVGRAVDPAARLSDDPRV